MSAPWIERLRVLLGAHRPKRVTELIGQRGCELHYLPSYSPDLNPIEEAFAKIKNLPLAGQRLGVWRLCQKPSGQRHLR